MRSIKDFIPYNDVIENFRASKNSTIVRQIRNKLMELVRGEKFNGRITEYFSHPVTEYYPLFFKSVEPDAETLPLLTHLRPTIVKKGDEYFLFGNKTGKEWGYTPLDNTLVSDALKNAHVALDVECELKYDTSFNQIYEEILVKVAHTNRISEPFLDFQNEPLQVAEYKKVLNALYFLEVVFMEVEAHGIGVLTNYITAENKTRDHAIKASQLLNIGVGVAEAFGSDIAQATSLLTKLYQQSLKASQKLMNATTNQEQKSIPYAVGFGSGIAVDQMQPDGSGNLDYDFLTNFTAVLPSYIDKITQFIKDYTATTEHGTTLSEQKLKELKKEGAELLTSIEKLQAGGSFGSLKLLNYIYLIGHIINLSQDILGQTGLLNEAAQEAVRTRIAYLKNDVLPHLLEMTDKTETVFMSNPGLLADPLMDKLTELYETWVVHYTKNIGNFDERSESLLKLNDMDFMQLRVASLKKQINDTEDKLLRVEIAKEALARFYQALSQLDKKMRLLDLPQEIKTQLLNDFKLFEPYLGQADKKLNQACINGLTQSTSLTTNAYDWTWGWFYNDEGLISDILPKFVDDSPVSKYLDKLQRSQNLQILINKDATFHIETDPKLVLFPYHRTQNIFEVSEESIVSKETLEQGARFVNSTILNPEILTQNETSTLYHLYKNKRLDLENALAARETLLAILDANFRANEQIVFGEHQQALKAKCMQLYGQIQPFLVSTHHNDANVLKFDKMVVEVLCGSFRAKKEKVRRLVTPESIHVMLNPNFLNDMETQASLLQVREQVYFDLYRNSIVSELQLRSFDAPGDRAAYLIKHTEGSKHLALLRETLSGWTALLDNSLKEKLTQAKTGIPFPEIDNTDDMNEVLKQGDQVLGLKQMMNFLYYSEQLLLELEKINEDDDTESYFERYCEKIRTLKFFNPELKVTHILLCISHVNKLHTLGNALVGSPYFTLVYKDIMSKVQPALATISHHIDPYTKGANEIGPDLGKPAEYSGLWYTLNALALLPRHIEELTGKSNLSLQKKEEKIRKIQEASKKANMKIERIIEDANSSYFKLLLDAPMVYPLFQESLYHELLRKIKNFTQTTNQAVLEHIEEINDQVFNQVLIELDQFESRIGLAPGTLSTPMKEILNEYYSGLVSALGFSFRKEEQLVSQLNSIKKRHDVVLARLNEIVVKQHELELNVNKINEFLKYLSQLNGSAEDGFLIAHQKFNDIVPLIQSFQQYSEQKSIALPLQSQNWNEMVYPSSKKEKENFKKLILLCKSYHEGLLEPIRLESNLTHSKLIYFEKLRLKQIEINEQFRKDYASQYFIEQVELYCSRTVGLVHFNQEYHEKLKAHLLLSKDELLASVSRSKDIDLALDKKIAQKTSEFETLHIKFYYQLDTTLDAIYQFKKYLAKADDAHRKYNTAIENRNLDSKNEFLNQLEKMAKESGDVSERLDEIKSAVESRGEMLTNYEHSRVYDFKWFKQRTVALLVSLNLYTTKRKAHHYALQKALNKEPTLQEFKERFGLLIDVPPIEDTSIEPELERGLDDAPFVVPQSALRDFFAITPLQITTIAQQFKLTTSQTEHLRESLNAVLAKMDTQLARSPVEELNRFLEKPSIYALQQELLDKFSKLAASPSTKEAIQQLEELNSVVFTKLLLAADTEEEAQKLTSGTLTSALKSSIDEFYEALVHSLSLDFHTKQSLLFNPSQTKQRIDARLERLDKAWIESFDIQMQYFVDLIKKYNPYEEQSLHLKLKKEATDFYLKIQPTLVREKPGEFFEQKFDFTSMKHEDIEYVFDQILQVAENYLIKNKRAKLEDSLFIKNQIINLNRLQEEADIQKDYKRSNYAQTNFELEIDTINQRALDLHDLESDYKEKLIRYLRGLKEDILYKSLNTPNINVKERILKKVKKFETEHVSAYYQLDAVIKALNEFEKYFELNHPADADKKEYILRLKERAENPEIDVIERYRLIRDDVRKGGEAKLLGDSGVQSSGFQYLVECIVSLLQALHLYPETKKMHYQKLTQSLENGPKMGELTKRFGLFYDPKAPPEESNEDKPAPIV